MQSSRRGSGCPEGHPLLATAIVQLSRRCPRTSAYVCSTRSRTRCYESAYDAALTGTPDCSSYARSRSSRTWFCAAGSLIAAKQREVASIAVHDELARREGDASAGALAPSPDCKANQLESLELATDEVDLCVRELVSGLPVFVAENLDFDIHGIPPRSGPTAFGRAWSFVALLCVCECEIRRRRTDPVPQPVLQRVHANEHGICGRAEIPPFAISSALPGQLGAVHEHEPRRGICAPVE